MTAGEPRPRPKVLHVLEALEGGTARHVVDVVRSVAEVDHHVAVPRERIGAPTDHLAVPDMADAGAQIHHLVMTRNPVRPANLAAAWRVRSLARRLGVDIVHGHSSVGGAIARMAMIGTPTPVLYTPNGLATSRLALAVELLLRRRTARFIAVSDSEALVARRALRIDDARLVVIPNGIDSHIQPHEVDLRAQLGIPPGAPLFGSIARLSHQKAPKRFLAIAWGVLGRVADAHAVLVGDGVLRDEFEAAVNRLRTEDPDRARRFHHIPSLENASRVLDQFDVFVLASNFEGAPYAPLEAMRVATPVVLSEVVGSRDAVEHGRSGLLVAPTDVDAFVDAVVGLLRDPERATAIGVAGQARQREHFDLQGMGHSLAKLYACSAET